MKHATSTTKTSLSNAVRPQRVWISLAVGLLVAAALLTLLGFKGRVHTATASGSYYVSTSNGYDISYLQRDTTV